MTFAIIKLGIHLPQFARMADLSGNKRLTKIHKLMARRVHVTYNKQKDLFQIKQDNATRSSGNFETQHQAIERAKEIAKNHHEELSIHGMNGKIRDNISYGNDPYPPKG